MLPREIRELIGDDNDAPLGPVRRAGALEIAEIDLALKPVLGDAPSTGAGNLVRAVIYLWHDYLDEAHLIAQAIETGDGSVVHGIMHRREPDYGNAKYWFRRAGKHPSFLGLSVQASELLERAGESDLQSRLVPNKSWDAFAFVDAVEEAAGGILKSKIPVLQQLQRLETEALLENLLQRMPAAR